MGVWWGLAGSYVPVPVELVAADREGVDLLLGVGQPGGVLAGVEFGVDGHAGGRSRGADQLDDRLVAGQRPAAPVPGDLREQPVFYLVPLGRARPARRSATSGAAPGPRTRRCRGRCRRRSTRC